MSDPGSASLRLVDVRKDFESGPHRVEVLSGISFSLQAGDALDTRQNKSINATTKLFL